MAEDNFDRMGRDYQEKVLQAMVTDHAFADQMSDVLDPSYFTFVHLQAIARALFEYRRNHREFPSASLIPTLLKHDDRWMADGPTCELAAQFLFRVMEEPLGGDRPWIEESSLDFCRKQALLGAMEEGLQDVERADYHALRKRIVEAMDKGSPKDHGHDYTAEGSLDARAVRTEDSRIPTGWDPIDKVTSGGWKRGTLCTFIAATGAGKSSFLVNAGCAVVEAGFNVLYVTLELAEKDIGLRCDSYFADIAINDVPEKRAQVAQAISGLKGRLIIKGWPMKRASVDTIRAHIERLKTTKGFVPDMLIVDYADLLRPMGRHEQNRHGLEENYEELRALMQELNMVGLTADQTNRGGLETDLVTIGEIGECYNKAQKCDLIMTITRNQEMKSERRGKLYNAKSRLGPDGQVFEFLMDTSRSVRVSMLGEGVDTVTHSLQNEDLRKNRMREEMEKLRQKALSKKSTAEALQ